MGSYVVVDIDNKALSTTDMIKFCLNAKIIKNNVLKNGNIVP